MAETVQTTITPWVSFTPTGSWTTNTTYTGFWKRTGDTMETQIKIALTGAPDAVALTINVPDGQTIDTGKLLGTEDPFGFGYIIDGGAVFLGPVLFRYSSAIIDCFICTTSPNTMTTVSATVPITFANTDEIYLNFKIPIDAWGA